MKDKKYGSADVYTQAINKNTQPDMGSTSSSSKANSSEGMSETVKNLASQAGEKLLDVAETEKAAGADFVGGVAGAMRRAAAEFESDVPQAAPYIRGAAEKIENWTQLVRKRDVNGLLQDVQDFARTQPTAFLGATVITGFVAMRFLKSSSAATGGTKSQ